MSLKRKETNKPMPESMNQLDTPPMVDMFKMISILNTGSPNSWKEVRQMFIKGQLKTPDPSKVGDINATLYNKVKGRGSSQEDIILDQMNFDTNSVIEQIHEGTVDVDAGQEELEKMKMVEGDMPGQGKHKQGNWGGGNV